MKFLGAFCPWTGLVYFFAAAGVSEGGYPAEFTND